MAELTNQDKQRKEQQYNESELSNYMKKDDEVRRPLLENMASPPPAARPTGASTDATQTFDKRDNRGTASPFDQSAATSQD